MTTERPYELSIVMPCLNEIATLEICVSKALRFLEQTGISGEIVVADNGSTDGSREVAQRLGARVVEVAERGYGAAVYHGVKAACGRYVIMGDSDDSYDFSRLHGFVSKLRDGYDLVMGNRFLGGIAPGAMPWKNRYIGNPLLSHLGRRLLSSEIGDFHCGLRGFSKSAFDRLELKTPGMEFASEMVIKAVRLGLKVTEIPTTLSPDGRSRPPHLRPWRDGLRHLRLMLLFSPNALFLYPGAVAVLLGLVRLWSLTQETAPWDPGSLLCAAALVILGAQSLLFGVLTRELAVEGRFLRKTRFDAFILSETTLDAGTALGAMLLLLGGLAGLSEMLHQSGLGVARLHDPLLLCMSILSGLWMCLGTQILLASLFLGAIKLNARDRGPSSRHP